MRMSFRTKMFGGCLWYSCLVLFTAVLVASSVCRASAEKGFLVGRISHVEGQLLRFVPAEKDWVATVKDAPFGMDDALYSDQNGKAEFIMPNDTWIRIGGITQIQLIVLKTDVTEVDVASGVARFQNKSSNALVKATTPFGYAVAQPGSSFDLYVGEQSAEVITLSGRVDFIHTGDNARYEVVHGSSSLIADASRVGSGEASVDANWDDWNVERDSLWSRRVSVKGDSIKYLPAGLHHAAYELEENGRWELVNYEGKRRRFWRPTRVDSGWAPFTAGRWTDYYGDNTWIPDEPFGYATHHYGNWVYVNNAWYWGPPQTVGFGLVWYPGRVAWIGSGADVGWVPLAPRERYYSHYPWGPAAYVIGTAAVVGLAIASLAYLDHAVLVPQHDFYGVNNYSRVRIANINRSTIISNYRAAPVVTDTIYKNYDSDRNRYNFTDAKVAEKPHNSVLNRIDHNQGIARQEGARVNANSLRRSITRTRPAPLPTETTVVPPKVTRKIVPADQRNKPASELKFQPMDLKERPKRVEPPRRGVAGQPAVERGRGGPEKLGETMRPSAPGAPGQGPTTSPRGSERVRPGKTRQPAESSGTPPSTRGQMMKPDQAGPKAPGTGHEPLKEQERVTPEPTTKPHIQGERHPGRQQPRMQQEPQPQEERQQVQQPQPRQRIQSQPRPQQQHQEMQQPQLRQKAQSQPQQRDQRPAAQREPQPRQQRQQVQQPQPRQQRQQVQQPQQQGDDKQKQKQRGREQQE